MNVPKPIIEHLGKGKTVDSLEFAIRGNRVELCLPTENLTKEMSKEEN
ncbi:MAG: hypothetical protein JRN11_07180 [Nitrososphaerota archaeon]|nr:hypothetical protein [Nitrososphaerota archaeon]MDG7013257.1 hypothetical protein [Nitrososphaerota archaeon]MDG7026512.1 hypothetical protein [Nitrososphaerota archaeon]